MKKINNILLVLLFILIAACGSKKTVTTSSVIDKTQTDIQVEKETKKDSVKVKETRTEKRLDSTVVVTIIEIEYEPVILEEGQRVESVPVKQTERKEETTTSQKQTTEAKDLEKKSEAETEKADVSQKKDVEKDEKKEEERTDPFKWRYIFYLSVLIIGVVLFLWIRNKGISNVFKIFKT